MKTSATPSFAAAKKRRVPLAQIDVHSASAAAKLGRVLPAASGRPVQAPTFNSAL
ncbi:FxSxx-COOH cyclophane-containing RiPP peptide [Streptomyces sp. SYSU K217416]